MADLTNIKPGVKYNIMVEAPEPPKNQTTNTGGYHAGTSGPPPGTPPQFWQISYVGIEPPIVRMYEEEPIEQIPASFPPAYQNSNNEGVEGLLTGRKCGNCIFFEAESGNCSKWNAVARDYYWCATWKTMEPIQALPNYFTQFIDQTPQGVTEHELYNFFIENLKDPNTQEPNLSNLLTPLNGLFSAHGAYLYGDALRRMVDSGNAFDFDNAPLDFFFTNQENFLNAIEFMNDGSLIEFDTPIEQHDSVHQHMCTYTLSKKANSTLPMGYPQTLKINLHGTYIGAAKNIISQLDFANAKIAYTPSNQYFGHRLVLLDNRFVLNEQKGKLVIDIIKPSIRERLLKFLNDNSKAYFLSASASAKFIQWVADRSFTSEKWQELYNYILTKRVLSSSDQNLLTLIENTLGEQLIDEPSYTQIPLYTTVGVE